MGGKEGGGGEGRTGGGGEGKRKEQARDRVWEGLKKVVVIRGKGKIQYPCSPWIVNIFSHPTHRSVLLPLIPPP